MTQKNILFVDDEINILNGLERMLYDMRDQWNMCFASDGQTALNLMAERPFDVVVSDMRMPGMDGSQLLNQVKQHYPNVVRIILSGYADREMIMSSLGATHQYLTKPCDPESLKAAVQRAFGLNSLFAQEPLATPLISHIHTLPGLPALYLQIAELLRAAPADCRGVAAAAGGVPSTAKKLCRLADEAPFAAADDQLDIDAADDSLTVAVKRLGVDTAQALVLASHVIAQQTDATALRRSAQVWRHGAVVGHCAGLIADAEQADAGLRSAAVTAGVLHDVGQLVMMVNLPREYLPILDMVERREGDLFILERMYFGASHAEVGAYLLGLWGLHDDVVAAAVNHHDIAEAAAGGFSAAVAVYAANAIVHNLTDHEGGSDPLDDDALRPFVDRLPVWTGLCRERLAASPQTAGAD